jgi:hypothetical protein
LTFPNERGEGFEGVECFGVEFGVFDSDAEGVFDEEGEIHEAEGINQSAGNERFVRREVAVGLSEDFFGDEFLEGWEDVGHKVSCLVFGGLFDASSYGVEGLKGGEVAPRPGGFHAIRVVKAVLCKGEMEAVLAESVMREWVRGAPEVPEGDIVFIGEADDGAVDGVVAFAVVGFGGEDGDDAFRDNVIEDLAHVGFVFVRRFFPPLFEADDGKRGGVVAEFARERGFVGFAGGFIRAEGGEYRGDVEAALNGETLAGKGAVEVVYRFL